MDSFGLCYNISNFDSKVHFKVHSVPFAYSRGRGRVKGKEKYNAVAEVRGGKTRRKICAVSVDLPVTGMTRRL